MVKVGLIMSNVQIPAIEGKTNFQQRISEGLAGACQSCSDMLRAAQILAAGSTPGRTRL